VKTSTKGWALFVAVAVAVVVVFVALGRLGSGARTTTTSHSPQAAVASASPSHEPSSLHQPTGWGEVAVSSPTPRWTPTVSPAAATWPLTTPTLKPQTMPATLVVTRVVKTGDSPNYDIYLVRSDGTGLRQLTDAAGVEEHAYWSPDGRRIVYSVYSSASIWVMNADGSAKMRLGKGSSPSWSPDGKRVLFRGEDGGVWVMNADGSGRRCVVGYGGDLSALIAEPAPPAYATWAANGAIVFVRVWPSETSSEGYPGGDLLAVNPDGSGFVWLTKGAGMILPSVSPDGRTIAAYVPREDRIVTMPWQAGAAAATLLARASHYFRNGGMPIAQWTSDGKKLVLGSSNYGEDRGSVLYLINADGSGLTRIPRVKDAICPDWRPQ
jgi:Tol biopolymer transport system component